MFRIPAHNTDRSLFSWEQRAGILEVLPECAIRCGVPPCPRDNGSDAPGRTEKSAGFSGLDQLLPPGCASSKLALKRTGLNIKSCGAATDPLRGKAYNGAMGIQVDAVYENGVLKPLQPLGLAEHEHVSVTVIKTTPSPGSPQLDIAYLENLQAELEHAGPAPGMEEVRRRLSKIPGSMTRDFIAERGDR